MGFPPDVSGAKGMFSHLSLLDKMLGPLVLLAMILGVIIGKLLAPLICLEKRVYDGRF
jgi:ACR3 family arsenite efflux pump ArsB